MSCIASVSDEAAGQKTSSCGQAFGRFHAALSTGRQITGMGDSEQESKSRNLLL